MPPAGASEGPDGGPLPGPLRPEDVPGWTHYPDTVLHVGRDPTLRLDLRASVPPAAARTLSRAGLAAPFVVITASHPVPRAGVRPPGPEEAARRHRALRDDLEGHGATPVPADGASPDGRHREAGWAAAIELEAARRLAARYGQAAIFRFDGRHFWIEPVLVAAAPIRLPVAGAR